MRLAIASDIHLEFGDYQIQNEESADLLVLAGDITTSQEIKNHQKFFQQCSEQFPYVIYTLGNHEHYDSNFYDTKNTIVTALSRFQNIFVLDRSRVFFDDWNTVFLVGTMWTNADRKNPLIMQKLKNSFSDFIAISNFDPMTMVMQHDAFLSYVNEYMEEYRNRNSNTKVVVVTHHAPSFQSVSDKYRTVNAWNTNFGFASYDEEFILNNSEISLWIHGHMHDAFDYNIGSTRVVCNPRGYVGYEKSAQNYKLKYLEI